MARKTITELYAQATADFADNTSGAITPIKLRQFCQDFLDTVRPSYAAIVLTTGIPVSVSTTDTVFSWSSIVAAQAPDWTVSLGSGNISRANGPASTQINFSIDCVAPNNSITIFTLYVDGVATPWVISNTSTSASDIQSFAFSAVSYSANLTPTYQIRAKSNGTNTVTLSNGVLVCQNIPVNVN